MAKVTWILADGSQVSGDVPNGESLMNAALDADVPNIIGECGGCLACATCHVFVDEAWMDKVGTRDATEESMLEFTEVPMESRSRLSCQINMTDELDGLILHVPE